MKKTLVTILLAALLFSFSGCKPSSEGNNNADPLANGEVHTDFPGVETRIAQVYTEDGKTKLEVIWSNNTDYEVMYGEPYAIQRLDGNEWVSCSKDEATAFITVGYALKAGKEISKTYTISELFDVSQPGTYRFKTSCSVYADGNTGQDCTLWAEFTLGNVKCPDDSKETGTTVEYCAQYIRTNGYQDGAKFPRVEIIRGLQDLKDYYTVYHEIFDLERKEKVYADTTVGFLDACDQYDEAFFEKNFLVFVLLEEGSGSVRHEVRGVEQTADKKLSVSIGREVPEVGTADMAEWHIILELSRDLEVESPNDVLVYLDGKLAWNGSVVEPPKPEAAFKKPPEGTLRTPEGDVTLKAAGYSWTYENPDGTSVSTIADQASRPLPADSLDPVTISSKHAETVYAYVTTAGKYEPTNSLGYFVKLAWETTPTSVTYTCWPDTVWQNRNTPEEAVVPYENTAFYAKPGAYIYEIVATWENTGAGCHGTANYYVYIMDVSDHDAEEHIHMTALRPQTVAEPITGYCGNTQTTLYIGNRSYNFMYENSVTLTDILVNLAYDPDKVCRCMAEYTVDTFGKGYQINLDYGFARCEKGQADLTQEQIDQIADIIAWAETTNCQYPLNG